MIAIAADNLGALNFSTPALARSMVITGVVALIMWAAVGGIREIRRIAWWKAAGLIALGLVALLAIQTAVNRCIPQ